MGKITDALKKAAGERLDHLEKIAHIKMRDELVIKRIKESKIDPSIITYFDSKAVISEQYKNLRTNILNRNKGKPLKSFVVTSALPGEGKTVTSLNIAISMAQAVSPTPPNKIAATRPARARFRLIMYSSLWIQY